MPARPSTKVALVLLLSMSMLAVAELALRLAFPDRARKIAEARASRGNPAYQFDEDFLIRLTPNIEKTFARDDANGGGTIRWRTNEQGFRGEPLEEEPGVRIIVYGDSNVQARFSALADSFPEKLETYLEAGGIPDVEVLNAGVIGAGPDQSLLRFRKEVDRYRPDVVIFHVFADNDFGDMLRNRLLDVDGGADIVETPFPRTADEQLHPPVGLREVASDLLIVMAARSALRSLGILNAPAGYEGGEAERDSEMAEYAELVEKEYAAYRSSGPRKFSVFLDHYDLDVATTPDAPSSRAKIALMNGTLRAARALAEEKGVGFLVVIQPSIIDMTTNYTVTHEDLAAYPGYDRRTLSAAVEKICVENGIPHVNLFDLFVKNKPENLFFTAGNNHWNDRGQDLAARETARHLLASLVDEGTDGP